MFHQLYVSNNKTKLASDLSRIEASGYKAIFVTIDNPIHGVRHREARYGWSNTTDHDAGFTWEGLKELQSMTSLPVIPKGIQSVEDAKLAVKAGCRAIYVSNHGGRQLDTSPHPIEVLLEIRQFAPWVFEKVEVYADGGVRYGTDVIKLLALGAKAVGIGRPFAYAGVYGVEGVKKLVEILKREVWIDMANVGLTDVGDAGMRYINARKLQMLL